MTDKTTVEGKMSELQNSLSPLMSKLYGGQETQTMPGQDSQPTVDEVD